MAGSNIISEWKKGHFKSVYWLEGPEDFFIDEIVEFAEKHLLTEEELPFNLTVFYGKDADWATVLNTCRAYPMFGERQVVILKEAQQMNNIQKLESYISAPNKTTVFIVAYKGLTLDKRTKVGKAIKGAAELFVSKKLYENQLPSWTNGFVQSQGLTITPKALTLLVNHVGNDLSRLANEILKLSINIKGQESITEDDIEKYIGISKDYNPFELIDALSFKNYAKAVSIIQYSKANPKSISIMSVLPLLYNFFAKLMRVYQKSNKTDALFRDYFYNNPVAIRQAKVGLQNYSFPDMEKAVLLIQQYNLKSLGVGSYNTDENELLKELVMKIME